MRQVTRSALVSETPARMFELINDIERYPEFVPWCSRAQVLSRTQNEIVARLEVKRGLLRAGFTTRNTLTPHTSIALTLVEGPFRSLQGMWTVTPILAPGGGEPGAGEPLGCRVQLAVSFEFSNAVAAALLEPVFEQTLVQLVDAFVGRARSLRARQA